MPNSGSRIDDGDRRLANRLYPGDTIHLDEMDSALEREFSISFSDGVLVIRQFLNPEEFHHSPYSIYLNGNEVEFGEIMPRYLADRGREWREVPAVQLIEQPITVLTIIQIVDTTDARTLISFMIDPVLPTGDRG